jgi:hypothetical protein
MKLITFSSSFWRRTIDIESVLAAVLGFGEAKF